jgi:anti-anti-sigma factor
MEIRSVLLDNGTKLIQLEGDLDLQGTAQVELKFTGYAASEKAGVVVDLSQVFFLASIGIRLLISSAKALNNRGGKMALLNPSPQVAKVLTLSQLETILPVFTSLEEASAYVQV